MLRASKDGVGRQASTRPASRPRGSIVSRLSISSVLVLSSSVRFSRAAKNSTRSRLIPVSESNASESASSPVPTRKLAPASVAGAAGRARRMRRCNSHRPGRRDCRPDTPAKSSSCNPSGSSTRASAPGIRSTRTRRTLPDRPSGTESCAARSPSGACRRRTDRRAPDAGLVASRVSLSATCVTGTVARERAENASRQRGVGASVLDKHRVEIEFHLFTVSLFTSCRRAFQLFVQVPARSIERLEQMRQFGGASHPKRNREFIRAKLLGQDHRNAARQLQRRDFSADLLLHSFAGEGSESFAMLRAARSPATARSRDRLQCAEFRGGRERRRR